MQKTRRKPVHQIVADLPTHSVSPGPPFTSVGVDTFGQWEIIARRTRGGLAQTKRLAIMISCLVSRAVHNEVVKEMSSSSFYQNFVLDNRTVWVWERIIGLTRHLFDSLLMGGSARKFTHETLIGYGNP
jgi:hypothetical protein